MTIGLANLPAIGHNVSVGGKTLRLNSIKPTAHQGMMYDLTEIGVRGPKKVTYLTTDAAKGFCTMVRI